MEGFLKQFKEAKITIFGVTQSGVALADFLRKKGKLVRFFDNDPSKNEKEIIPNVLCKVPVYDDWSDKVYVTLQSTKNQKIVADQLEILGYKNIVIIDDRERKLLEENCEDRVFVEFLWGKSMGYKLNLNNPITFNEKLQWLKLYDRNPLYTRMVDKYDVKEYVTEVLGEKRIIDTIGVWEHFDEIPFDKLPQAFVLKCTHDSGSVAICKDKEKFDYEKIKERLGEALKRNYFYPYREWPYKDVKPRIIAEPFIKSKVGDSLLVYKFLCFGGVPKIIQVIQNDKQKDESIDYFDTDWNLLDLRQNFPNSKEHLPKPKTLEKMKELAAKLSVGRRVIRVDFYEIDDEPVFSEFTFFSDSGLAKFYPEKWDKILGDWIDIS